MEQEYARWLDGRRAVFRNLKGLMCIRNDLGLVSTKDLGMVGVDARLPAAVRQLDDAIEEAKRCVANVSCPGLLAWTGPYGCVSHVADRCRIALEDYADENGIDKDLTHMCVVASRLFQKKSRNFGKWELARGEVNGNPHIWCERNGVALDLTRTQFEGHVDRVFVVPANRYPCTRRLDATKISINEDFVERVERFYTCDEFVKRKHKK
jgi:hypothetical protein